MLKITTHNHLPIQVYKFFAQVGPLQLVLSQGQILLRYAHIEHTHECYMKFRRYKIDGKDIEIEKAYTWYTPQQLVQLQKYKQKMENIEEQIKKLYSINKHQAIILQYKVNLLKFIQDYFGIIDKETLVKVNYIKFNYDDKVSCDRELDVLQRKLKNGFQTTLTNFRNSVKSINSVIKNFDVSKEKIIEVEPSFQHKEIKKKQMPSKIFKMNQGIQFINLEKNAIKRIIALNQKEFVVSQRNTKSNQGQVKFYKSDSECLVKKIDFEKGPYALACLDAILFVGDSAGGVSAISLDKDKQIESMPQPIHNPDSTIFDIRFNAASQIMYTAATGQHIKLFSIAQDQITDSLSQISYTQKISINTGNSIRAFQTITPEIIAYATVNKLIFKNIEAENQKVHILENNITRIKNFQQNMVVFCDGKGFLSLYDTRVEKVVNKFAKAGENLSSIDINPHTIFYGGLKVVGCFDDRKPNFSKWHNTKTHQDIVKDILVLNSELISGDQLGKLVSWKWN